MLTPVDAFAASPWREEILTEVLRFGRARPGLTMVAPFDWHTLERRPWRRDGECDCAVYELGYDLAEHVEEPVGHTEAGGVPVVIHHEWPWPEPPACAGVRRGSVKPCDLWEPLANLQ